MPAKPPPINVTSACVRVSESEVSFKKCEDAAFPFGIDRLDGGRGPAQFQRHCPMVDAGLEARL
jgi:hypothetical protein